MSDPDWMALLRAEVDGSSIASVAKKIGYSRPALSLVLAGRYPGETTRVAAAVLAHLADRVSCPAVGTDVARADCRRAALAPMPMSTAAALRAWQACRECPHRPQPDEAAP
ncbi:MAG: LacI family transcriptional regulator [Alphaproteobacteria bacterium]|nr:LacI family transcriptional regulator [Alphaproteobacteria bacterium]